MTDPGTPDAQPAAAPDQDTDPGQNGQSQGGIGDLYDLSTAPAELRPYLEEQLQKIAGNVGKKFEEHAGYRKQWEPFEQVEGLRDVPADELAELVQFREVFQDEESFKEWWNDIGERLELFETDEGEGDEQDEFGDDGEQPPSWAQSLIDRLDQLEGTVKPISESVSQGEAQRRQDAASKAIDSELDALQEEHGDFDREAVVSLALPFGEQDDAIAQGFKRYQQITGKAQGDLADQKLGQPDPAKPGGQADTSPEQFSNLDDPALKRAARARLAGSNVG